MNPINALTIDVEDYFQVHALSKSIQYDDWYQYSSTVEKNTNKILDLLDAQRTGVGGQRTGVRGQKPDTRNLQRSTRFELSAFSFEPGNLPKASFFILGWIAERYPDLVKEIHRRGHEIASHGYRHQVIYDQTPKQFQEDIKISKQILEDLTGEEVIGYRAPTYSITKKTMWALNILAEEGYKYDSSIFPIRHDYYGMPSAPRFPFIWNLNNDKPKINQLNNPTNSNMLFEFPISTVKLFGRNLPCSGGGYFRLFPYSFIKAGLRRINKEGSSFIFYLHPWELDPDIPRTKNLSPLARFRTYVNLNKTESRFKKLISQFRFSSIKSLYNNLTQQTQSPCYHIHV